MKKILMTLLLLSTIAMGEEDKKIKIGITQIMEHEAFDEARKGFIQELKSRGYEDIEIEYQNAQGDYPTSQLIANSFVQDKKDIILAISTPSAQAAYNVTKEIPILFSAITDPEGAGLIGENITGTTNFLPMSTQLDTIKNILPKAKKIGILHNTSEQNSEIQFKRAKEEGEKYGYEILDSVVSNINDMNTALDNLLPKVDVLYTITDSLVVSATPLILNKANKANVPVVGCIESQVAQGALVTTTLDYRKLGEQTGDMAIRIIQGEEVKNIKIEGIKESEIIINREAAKRYKVDLTEEILKKAKIY